MFVPAFQNSEIYIGYIINGKLTDVIGDYSDENKIIINFRLISIMVVSLVADDLQTSSGVISTQASVLLYVNNTEASQFVLEYMLLMSAVMSQRKNYNLIHKIVFLLLTTVHYFCR